MFLYPSCLYSFDLRSKPTRNGLLVIEDGSEESGLSHKCRILFLPIWSWLSSWFSNSLCTHTIAWQRKRLQLLNPRHDHLLNLILGRLCNQPYIAANPAWSLSNIACLGKCFPSRTADPLCWGSSRYFCLLFCERDWIRNCPTTSCPERGWLPW